MIVLLHGRNIMVEGHGEPKMLSPCLQGSRKGIVLEKDQGPDTDLT